MSSTIDELRETLLQGINLSMQGSYHRRAPADKAKPFLHRARNGLRVFVQTDPKCAEAWRLLSQAEECLLDYSEAVRCLETAMALAENRSKSELKRLAMLKEARSEWSALQLSGDQLAQLGEYLSAHGIQEGSPRDSMHFTQQWLAQNKIEHVEQVIQALNERGAFSDFQVLYNVVRG